MPNEVRGDEMADALTTAAAPALLGAGGIITISSFFPGVDLSSVVGSFGGALFFIFFAKDINNWQRLGYLFIGWIGGYFSAAELLAQAWTKTSGFSSFIAGLLCVVVCISIVEGFQTGKMPEWLSWIWNRRPSAKEPDQ